MKFLSGKRFLYYKKYIVLNTLFAEVIFSNYLFKIVDFIEHRIYMVNLKKLLSSKIIIIKLKVLCRN